MLKLYDLVELPSKGVTYKNIAPIARVNFLTTRDELLLNSPEIINNNLVLETVLERALEPELFQQINYFDAESILFYLWVLSYGFDLDFNLDGEIETVDLSLVKHQKSNLYNINSNGNFDIYIGNDKYEFTPVTFYHYKSLLHDKKSSDINLLKTTLVNHDSSVIDDLEYTDYNKLLNAFKSSYNKLSMEFKTNKGTLININPTEHLFKYSELFINNLLKEVFKIVDVFGISYEAVMDMTIFERRKLVEYLMEKNNED